MEKTCSEVKGLKDNVDAIKEDVSTMKKDLADIKNQNTGMTDLLTQHIDHHPKMRMKQRTVSEKILEARYQLIGLFVTGLFSVIIALIGTGVIKV